MKKLLITSALLLALLLPTQLKAQNSATDTWLIFQKQRQEQQQRNMEEQRQRHEQRRQDQYQRDINDRLDRLERQERQNDVGSELLSSAMAGALSLVFHSLQGRDRKSTRLNSSHLA